MTPMSNETINTAIRNGDALGQKSGDTAHWEAASSFPKWLAAARPRLLRLACLRGVAPDAVEDVVQETLLEAWTHRERLYAPAGFHLWLDEICRNVCRRSLRTRASDRRRLAFIAIGANGEESAEGAAFQDIPDTELPDPLDALCREDMATLLDRALSSLSNDARDIVELCYLKETPQREAAEQVGLSISAVEARLHRARQQLRRALNGPLRADAEALGLTLDQESADGWRETRLWCTLCGQRRLMGMFLPQPDGTANLHMRCPDCERRYGLSDVQSSNVHSRGLIPLVGLRAFRPAWKRTMRGVTQRFIQAMSAGEKVCPYCGTPALLQLIEKTQRELEQKTRGVAPPGLAQHPYQFWVWWQCPQCHTNSSEGAGIFAASDLVYWSDESALQFMADHARWISEPELLVEYAGRPAIRFQMADCASAARLTVLADRQTLRVLAVR